MKIKRITTVVTVLLLVALAGTVVAYMVHRTASKQNVFHFANISHQVNISGSGKIRTSLTVENTGEMDVYVRVRFVSNWVNGTNLMAKPSEIPVVTNLDTNNWIYDATNYTYYYKHKLKADGDDETPNLLENGGTITPITLNVSSEGYNQTFEVVSEAIQAEPDDAVIEAWGATVDANGVITAIS